jgi:hypothetical protein
MQMLQQQDPKEVGPVCPRLLRLNLLLEMMVVVSVSKLEIIGEGNKLNKCTSCAGEGFKNFSVSEAA